jgi:hypothetical protein
MITCVVEYVIDLAKLVNLHFGTHHGYFLPTERASEESGCVLRYERSFMRPVLPGS